MKKNIFRRELLIGSGGAIQAHGGSGNVAGGWTRSDSGGGGRVAVYYKSNTHAGGLNYGVYGGSASYPAAAGTIFYKDEDDLLHPNGYLLADNNNIPHVQGVETPLPPNATFDDISTQNLGTFIIPSTDTYQHFSSLINFRLVIAGVLRLLAGSRDWEIGPLAYIEWRRIDEVKDWDDITIQSGGVFTHSMNSDTPKYKLKFITLNLNVAGSINVTARGYAPNQGPGTSSSSNADGASYGGLGGYTNGSRRSPYGDARNPQFLGSGCYGAYGGGWIDIDTSKLNFSNLGSILADAQAGGGGASGGSIKVNADSIEGVGGVISAQGGTGNGGGSGGRIALAYNAITYGGGYAGLVSSVLTTGGDGTNGGLVTGTADGASGTLFTLDKTTVAPNNDGHLIVKNSPRNYSEMTTTPLVNDLPFDSITTDSSGTILIPVGFNFLLPSSTINYRVVAEGAFTIPAGTDLTIDSGGYLEYRNAVPLSFGVLTINSGGMLTHTRNYNVRQYLLDITADSIALLGDINVSGKGYGPNMGPGLSSDTAIGAGYGGFGGLATETTLKLTSAYGMDKVKTPDDIGSGSYNIGGAQGAFGGGIIKLTTTALDLRGSVKAEGTGGNNQNLNQTAGGSGGSIYINVIGGPASITGTTSAVVSVRARA